jgi:hypothetical protein
MGTEIKTELTRLNEHTPETAGIQEHKQKIPEHLRKCICGCNAPMLYAKRECNTPYSNPRSNFKAILNVFFKGNPLPPVIIENIEIDIYNFFHIILRIRTQLGRISWRRVSKALGVQNSTSEYRKALKKYYKTYLRNFEAWTQEKGPVSIGCIDTQLVIIILKEFIPNCFIKKEETLNTLRNPAENIEIPNTEVRELIEAMISDIESGKIIIKKRKTKETLPNFNDPLELRPIFLIKTSKSPKKQEKKPEKKIKNPKPEIEKKKTPALNVSNPMTDEFRDKDPGKMGFRTDFRRGYLPIEMQEEHEKIEKFNAERESKAHFIRKKQSAVNIKRSCGVTYIKPTESKQKGVAHEFELLPPLAFQIATVDRTIPKEERPEYFNMAINIIKDIFQPGKILRVTVQTEYSEEDLKNYLLGQKPYQHEIFVDNINDLWKVLGKDNFVCIHFQADEKYFITPADHNTLGNVCIGFLVKKGLCGTRSVKKCLNLPEKEDDTLNIYATQIRLELYITKKLWKYSLSSTKKLLCAFISEFESFIQKKLPEWNLNREIVHKEKKIKSNTGIYKWNKTCKCEHKCPYITPKGLWEYKSNSRPSIGKSCSICNEIQTESLENYQKGLDSIIESKSEPNWYYLINTRDSFSYDLKIKKSHFYQNSRKITKKEFYFHKDDLPSNFKDWNKYLEGDLVRTGVVTYHNCFTHQELLEMEQDALNTEQDFIKGRFLKNTAQPTYGAGGKIKRTKFFFGTRYMWTATQLAEKQSKIAAGVRVDVSATPNWMKNKIENPLVDAGVIEKGFINSIAMNIYHDGKEGLAQHFDDAVRFKQPIYTVKLDSDSRLSFGSQFYGYSNGAFCIPCPRGAVCVLEEFSYSANSAKHCVRPCDLAGRSITIILRQIHPFIMEEAIKYDEEIDLPTWMSCLSIDDNAVEYASQKEMQAKDSMKCDAALKSLSN